jgi:tetratricopeptide (TPR) repeat protein
MALALFPLKRPGFVAGSIIAVAAMATYWNSFAGPFVFDDIPSILDNPTILHLGRLREVLSPPFAGGVTVGGRPLANLSLAINYAISGYNVWSYHALNLVVHVLAGMTLFGLARRTLDRTDDPTRKENREVRFWLAALAIALIWTVHPLQTESVSYVIQRTESMMGLFYLLTLYAFARGTEGETPAERGLSAGKTSGGWLAVSWLACLAGMATKEVMVSAPVIVFLYDRCFAAGSVREAWRRHRRYYVMLASTWLLLAWLVVQTGGNRGGSTGIGSPVPWVTYAISQFPAIVHYLSLAVWPHPLVFYYPARWPSAAEVVPFAITVVLLAAGTAYALVRNLAIGFLGTWFFAVLAPSSLIAGAAQTVAEHRMYLALVPVTVVIVVALLQASAAWLPRSFDRGILGGLLCAAVALAIGTRSRNETYRSELALWTDTANSIPGNALAENNVGIAFADLGNQAAAKAQFEKALLILPSYPNALINLGNILRSEGRAAEATAFYERALSLKPDTPEALVDLANVLREQGRIQDAIDRSERALELRPLYAEGYNSLALCLAQSGDLEGAIKPYLQALELKPDYPEADYNLANAMLSLGRKNEAIERYRMALRLSPTLAEAHNGLGIALAKEGRIDDSADEYRRALASRPDYAEAAYNLGNLLVQAGRLTDAIAVYRTALRSRPGFSEAEGNLANALFSEGRPAEAVGFYIESLRLRPDSADTHYNLALALRAVGRTEEANDHFREAARLKARATGASP